MYLSLGTERMELARKNGQYMIDFLSVMEYFLTPRKKKKKKKCHQKCHNQKSKEISKKKNQESKEW